MHNAVRRAARTAGTSEADLLRQVSGGRGDALAVLVDATVVTETHFFRHPAQLRAVRHVAAAAGREVRIWSAACATGEEVYSVAMELDEARLRDRARIVGTDISGAALSVAARARYGAWSMRGVAAERRTAHFIQHADDVEVRPHLRRAVTLSQHNLLHDPRSVDGGPFDVILCRNVLIYFDTARAHAVVRSLLTVLARDGLLLLGPADLVVAQGMREIAIVDVAGARGVRRAGRLRAVRGGARTGRGREGRPATHARAGETTVTAGSSSTASSAAGGEAGLAAALLAATHEAARLGDPELMEDRARAAAEAHGATAEAFEMLAAALDARGALDDAAAALGRALYLDPGSITAHASLVSVFERRGHVEKAERARRTALRLLEAVGDRVLLRGIVPVEAGALRRALARRR